MAVLDDGDPRVIDGIAAHHRDAAAFIRALGFDEVDLLGFSLGGAVAQLVALQEPGLVRRMILAGTGPRGGGGIDEITKVAVNAYLKAALTLSDARNFLFFPRTAEGKHAAKDYLARLKERTADRDKRISVQARRAQPKAIRAAGLSEPAAGPRAPPRAPARPRRPGAGSRRSAAGRGCPVPAPGEPSRAGPRAGRREKCPRSGGPGSSSLLATIERRFSGGGASGRLPQARWWPAARGPWCGLWWGRLRGAVGCRVGTFRHVGGTWSRGMGCVAS